MVCDYRTRWLDFQTPRCGMHCLWNVGSYPWTSPCKVGVDVTSKEQVLCIVVACKPWLLLGVTFHVLSTFRTFVFWSWSVFGWLRVSVHAWGAETLKDGLEVDDIRFESLVTRALPNCWEAPIEGSAGQNIQVEALTYCSIQLIRNRLAGSW